MTGHRVTWFDPTRPVGGTVHVRRDDPDRLDAPHTLGCGVWADDVCDCDSEDQE